MHTQQIPVIRGAVTPPSRGALGRGVALTQLASLGNQVGAAVGALAFPVFGPIGVVAVRQLVAAAVLVPIARPSIRAMRRADWLTVVALGLIFTVMNTSVYLTIERLGLGLAITLEFLGPLALVMLSARRLVDLIGGIIAATGVVVLVNPGPSTDIIGIATGLVSAAAWAAYILLTRRAGGALPGVQGPALASLVSGIVWVPIAIVWFQAHPPTLWALALAIVCGLFSSVLPFSLDTLSLRLLPAGLFSTLQSMHPVWAAAVGLVVLRQELSLQELVGIALVVLSNVLVTSTSAVRAKR